MADITQAGSTGRKPRGAGGTAPASGEGTGGTAPVAGAGNETATASVEKASTVPVAVAGTAEQAAQAASEPVVIGAGPVPEIPGGPGVGAARTARPIDAVEARPLTDAAAEGLGLRPAGANDPLTARERDELYSLRRARDGASFVVDAAEVPGQRLARAMTAIRRDGVLYAPDGDNRWVPVDFRAYTELVGIGAISDTPWNELDDASDD
ncbi:hypothetical protein [Methylobacterium iners]|uniref:Uncharacterized protein n=1 Tax=Methylobacterium iners TaxID=418707 RepID=A0ABQ4RUH0_9HYPH|nr:hypothetical protein [Methylobacterium iners]GJD93333.1 hypothetical protein OCOJLMKI_0525 [Methylobacterium iners]